MRFFLVFFAIIVVSLIGLLIYGQMLEPQTSTIKVEVEVKESDG